MSLIALLMMTGITGATAKEGESQESSVLGFTMRSIDGTDIPLSAYSGKVILLVNVASKCGYTPQYKDLEELYLKYKDRGLVILGFPANNFGSQEPGTDAEINQGLYGEAPSGCSPARTDTRVQRRSRPRQ